MSPKSSRHSGIMPFNHAQNNSNLTRHLDKVLTTFKQSSIEFKTCPECGNQVDKKQRSCDECSYNFFTRKKKCFRRRNPYHLAKNRTHQDTQKENCVGFTRSSFFIANILNIFIYATFSYLILGLAFFSQIKNAIYLSEETELAFIATIFIFSVCSIYIGTQRLKNLGASAWQILLIFIPVAQVWLLYRLAVCPENYVKHKTLDKCGKILIGIYTFSILTLYFLNSL